MSIPVKVNRRIARARKKETNCAIINTDLIAMVCTLIEDYSRPINRQRGFKPIKKVACTQAQKGEVEWEGEREKGKGALTHSPHSPFLVPFLPIPDCFRCLLRELSKK